MSLLNIVKEQGIVSIINAMKEDMEQVERIEKFERLVEENTSFIIKTLDERGLIYERNYLEKEDYTNLKDKSQEELFDLYECDHDFVYDILIEKNIDWGTISSGMGNEELSIPKENYKKYMTSSDYEYMFGF